MTNTQLERLLFTLLIGATVLLSSSSSEALGEQDGDGQLRAVALPHLSVYLTCRYDPQSLHGSESRQNSKDDGNSQPLLTQLSIGSSSPDSTNLTTSQAKDVFIEYFLELTEYDDINETTTTTIPVLDLTVKASSSPCIASDIMEITLTSDGTYYFYNDTVNEDFQSTSDFQEQISPESLQTMLEGSDAVCPGEVLYFNLQVKSPGGSAVAGSSSSDNPQWKYRLSTTVCGLTDEAIPLSTSMIVLISACALLALGLCLCLGCFCMYRRRRK